MFILNGKSYSLFVVHRHFLSHLRSRYVFYRTKKFTKTKVFFCFISPSTVVKLDRGGETSVTATISIGYPVDVDCTIDTTFIICNRRLEITKVKTF